MKKISVPQQISTGLKEFLSAKDIYIEIVNEGGDLTIEDTGAERLESTLTTLYSGGWITCATARTTADRNTIWR